MGFLIIVVGIVYIKRRQRLRLQQARRITIDGLGTGAATETQEVSGTVTLFTLTSLISQPGTPLTKSSAITVPPAQKRVANEQRLTQPRGTHHRVDSEGRDTLAETV